MKFLNEIDGADKLKQDSNNRLVTDEEKQEWDSKASNLTLSELVLGDMRIIYNAKEQAIEFEKVI